MHEACNLNDGDGDTDDDHEGTSEAGKEDKNSEEYGNQGAANILVNLLSNDFIHNPVGVTEMRVKSSCKVFYAFLTPMQEGTFFHPCPRQKKCLNSLSPY